MSSRCTIKSHTTAADASGSPRTSSGARTKRGEIVYEVQFRDVDGRTRRRRLDARSERAAIKEARAVLASRDGGERIVAANVTVDAFADQEYFPMLEGLVAAGRRAERGRDRYRYDYDRYVQPPLGAMRLGEIEPRHLSELIRTMRLAGYAESTIVNALIPLRGLYRLARGLTSRSPFDGLDPAEMPGRPRPAPLACSTRTSSPRSSAMRRAATSLP